MAIAPSLLGIASREITTMARPLFAGRALGTYRTVAAEVDPPAPRGGQPPVSDRNVLTGILFVLKTGIPWEDLPCEMNCGCGDDLLAAGCGTGRPTAPGTRSTRSCSTSCGAPTRSPGRRALIDSSFVRGGLWGRGHRAQPGGPVQARQQAPRDHRRERHPADVVGHGPPTATT